MGVAGKTILVGTGVAAGAFAVLWFLRRGEGGSRGWGLGWGSGGSLFGPGGEGATVEDGKFKESGPLEDQRGDGGDSTEDVNGDSSHGGQDGTGENSSGEGKPGDGKSGDGKEGNGKGGTGGQGGGFGGGTGGGIGSGKGQGTGGDFDEGGNEGDDNGGGDEGDGLYDPWEGQLIDQDLQPPDTSKKKLADLHATISDLVVYSVLDPGKFHPGLPQPLHRFDPELGGLLKFWADVAIHLEYPQLPPGRLDPDVASHVPWINLWLDAYALTATIEAEINGSLG